MVDRRTFARLKKLLLARDVDLVEQGVELVVSLDDPELWDALLEGVEWIPPCEEQWPGRTVTVAGGWTPNALFTGTAPAQPFHELALTLLVAHAPGPVRDQVTGLRIRGSERLWRTAARLGRIPLDALERYPNLRALDLE